MAITIFLLFCFASFVLSADQSKKADKKDDLTRGFRDDINWVKYEDAVSVARDLNKPIFFLIHKTWCGACKNLKREFKNAPRILDLLNLSDKFVMVNVEDDEEPQEDKFMPDGGYIPRILFLDLDGNPMKTNNENRYKNNKYFYPLVPQIIDGMERALNEFALLEGGVVKKSGEVKAEKKQETPEKAGEKVKEKSEEKKKETTQKKSSKEEKAAKEEEVEKNEL